MLRNTAALTAEEVACRNNASRCIYFLNAYSTAPELHRAAMVNDIAAISSILEGEPNLVNSMDDTGRSALHIAASSGYSGACQALCEVTCHPPLNHCMILVCPYNAALATHRQRGARPDLPDQAGRTPIQTAREARHVAVAAIMETVARTPRAQPASAPPAMTA